MTGDTDIGRRGCQRGKPRLKVSRFLADDLPLRSRGSEHGSRPAPFIDAWHAVKIFVLVPAVLTISCSADRAGQFNGTVWRMPASSEGAVGAGVAGDVNGTEQHRALQAVGRCDTRDSLDLQRFRAAVSMNRRMDPRYRIAMSGPNAVQHRTSAAVSANVCYARTTT